MKNHKSNIYIKKIDTIGKISVWLVDGEYIRKNIDENFVEFDEHYRFSFIPKNEFWIDHETEVEERPFFIDHLLVERGFIEKGYGYKEANAKADLHEKRQRMKLMVLKKLAKLKKHRGELINKIHKKLLKKYSKNVNVWLVDGALVRDFFLVEYSEGGHDRVYPFIPKNEVWIEHILSPKEIRFITLHELHERFLMGEGKSYKDAHKGATIVEDRFRDNPKGLEKRIKEEILKN